MKDGLILMPYKEMLDKFGRRVFKKMRASFSCARNQDVERFIHTECSKYEKDDNTRNYFLFDTDESEIAVFFTLSLHSIILGDLVSNLDEDTMSILRGYGKREARSVGCYLIGQLARNDKYNSGDITGDEILSFIKSKLSEALEIVAGRFVAIDCEAPLIPFYEKNSFVKVNRHGKLFTMIMPIPNLPENQDLKE